MFHPSEVIRSTDHLWKSWVPNQGLNKPSRGGTIKLLQWRTLKKNPPLLTCGRRDCMIHASVGKHKLYPLGGGFMLCLAAKLIIVDHHLPTAIINISACSIKYEMKPCVSVCFCQIFLTEYFFAHMCIVSILQGVESGIMNCCSGGSQARE